VATVTAPKVDADATAIISFAYRSGKTVQTTWAQVNIRDAESLLADTDFTLSPAEGDAALTVQMAADRLSGQPLPGGTFNWTYGDGPNGAGMNVSHTYQAGSWTVMLCATFGGGTLAVTGCKQKSVTVHERAITNAPPTAAAQSATT